MGWQPAVRLVTALLLAVALLVVVGLPAVPPDPSSPLTFAGARLLQVAVAAAAWIAVVALVASVAVEWVARLRGRAAQNARTGRRTRDWVVLGVGVAVLVAAAAHSLNGVRVCCADPGSVREAVLHAH